MRLSGLGACVRSCCWTEHKGIVKLAAHRPFPRGKRAPRNHITKIKTHYTRARLRMGTEFYLSAPLFLVKNKSNKGHWTQNIWPPTEETLGFIFGSVASESWLPFLGRGSCEELPGLPPFHPVALPPHLVYLLLCSRCRLLSRPSSPVAWPLH